MKSVVGILAIVVLSLTSCIKEDAAVVLPPPGDMEQLMAVMGTDYNQQVYVSLSKKQTYLRNSKNYDLAFEASSSGMRIYLNGAKFMFAADANTFSLMNADSSGKSWNVDDEELHADSGAFAKWWTNLSNADQCSHVYLIDRGRIDFTGSNRWWKFQVLHVDADKYTIAISRYDNAVSDTVDIVKDPAYALMYFNFDAPHQLVQQAPPSSDWDIVFTKYTHVYYDQPLTSPYRFYPVTGVISNVWAGTQCLEQELDSVPNFIDYNQFVYNSTPNYVFSNDADIIGFDWKYFDFGQARYFVYPNQYFVVKASDGLFYKLRMIDFYDPSGNKGSISMEYQRL
jgi:hypothetical protein